MRRTFLRRRRALLAAAAVWLAAGAGTPARTPAEQPPAAAPAAIADVPAVASYDIQARLDPEAKTVTASQRLTWRNPTDAPVSELWFHLYLNAFRDRDSTFFRESGGQLRDTYMPGDGWGRIELSSLRVGRDELLPSLTYEAPDDGNAKDRTLARVPLPSPVPPGGEIRLDVAFTSHLPKAFARTGYYEDYFLVGQWFPKIAVLEPARGDRPSRWTVHQFHAYSEFYADFGRYRVSLTVPSRFVVGATGVRVDRRAVGNGTTTYVYEQAGVHDFAWTASPRFVDVTRRFVAAEQVTAPEYAAAAARLGRPVESLRLSDVDVRLLIQPEHQPQAERYFRAAFAAIEAYGLAYGPYPYRTLTMVDPPQAAEGTAGMEYPTFVTLGTDRLLNAWPFDRIYEPEIVVVHEIGHQYFQGLLASNEFEEPWLDEGITTWAAAQVLDTMLGADRSVAELAGLRFGSLDLERVTYHRGRVGDRTRAPAWAFDEGYAFNVYHRPSLTLRTLERLVGRQTMARVMRAYVERWRFRHPTGDDFYAVASEVAGRDLRPFFRQALESTAVIDYKVGAIRRDGDTLIVTVRREGDLQIPIAVAFKFAGRPVEPRTWDGAGHWTRFTFEHAGPLEWVDVDPDRNVALDVSWLNNGRLVEPDGRAAASMTSRWLLAVQPVLEWLAF